MSLNPADLGDGQFPTERVPAATTPFEQLSQQVADARKEVEDAAEKPVTIADVAAAAFTALYTLVNLLPAHSDQIINDFEQRAAMFAASLEEDS